MFISIGGSMSGLVFLKTRSLEIITDFYMKTIGMTLWLDQGGCRIFKHGNMLLGFCQKEVTDVSGVITFFFESISEVDNYYNLLSENADGKPRNNADYQIYHFYSHDPEGRVIEFQTFLNKVDSFCSAEELLIKRRSIRQFKTDLIPQDKIKDLFNLCRFSPTSMNRDSFYYVITENKEILHKLAQLRDDSSKPIARAPYAVAVVVDPEKTKRSMEDGHIAAYHFLLAARNFGLGTCWIADMNKEEAKTLLDIPLNHYIATITPLGFPNEKNYIPERRNSVQIFRTKE